MLVAAPDASVAQTSAIVETCNLLGLRTHLYGGLLPGTWRNVDARQHGGPDLPVVHGVAEVVAATRRPEVDGELDVDDEVLALAALVLEDPVVAAPARDDELAMTLAGLHVGDTGELHGGVDRLAARAGDPGPAGHHGAADPAHWPTLQPGGHAQRLDPALAHERRREGVPSGRRAGGARNGARL